VATERKSPDALLIQTNLSGALSAIADDPDTPDATWLTAISNNADGLLVVSFPAPSGNPTPGAGLQQFKFRVRNTPNNSTTFYNIYLRENGARVGGLLIAGQINGTTGQTIAAVWDAAGLAGADGSGVEAELELVHAGGSPSNRTAGEVGAAEWNVTYSLATSTGQAAITPAPFAAAGIGAAPAAGQAALPIAPFSASATGLAVEPAAGQAAIALDGFTAAGVGQAGDTATGQAAIAIDGFTAAGVGSAPATGQAAPAVAGFAAAASGDAPAAGLAAVTIGSFAVAGTGAAPATGQAAPALAGFAAAAGGAAPAAGQAAVTTGSFAAAGTGAAPATGQAALAPAPFSASASATGQAGDIANCVAAIVLGPFTALAAGSAPATASAAIVLGGDTAQLEADLAAANATIAARDATIATLNGQIAALSLLDGRKADGLLAAIDAATAYLSAARKPVNPLHHFQVILTQAEQGLDETM
jgi:hypothetical protein